MLKILLYENEYSNHWKLFHFEVMDTYNSEGKKSNKYYFYTMEASNNARWCTFHQNSIFDSF